MSNKSGGRVGCRFMTGFPLATQRGKRANKVVWVRSIEWVIGRSTLTLTVTRFRPPCRRKDCYKSKHSSASSSGPVENLTWFLGIELKSAHHKSVDDRG